MRAHTVNSLLPVDEYTLEIVETDYQPNATGTGMALNCLAQVVVGQFEGSLVGLSYTLEHRDPRAVEIGQRDFAGLRRATGVLELEDSAELHFKPFRVKIGVHQITGANVIKQYLFGAPMAA